MKAHYNHSEREKIKEELKAIYLPCYENYIKYERYSETAYPYLITASKAYLNAKFRIMVFGQETNTWGDEMARDCPANLCIEDLMGIYESLIAKDNHNKPFWNFNRFLRKLISTKTETPVGWIYNNIVKIGRVDKKGCDDGINNWTIKNFNVIRKEIDILAPNLVLFMTGPNYDDKIKAALGPFRSELINGGCDFDLKHLYFINDFFPNSFKCYHPGGLRKLKGLYHYAGQELCNILLDEIKNYVSSE